MRINHKKYIASLFAVIAIFLLTVIPVFAQQTTIRGIPIKNFLGLNDTPSSFIGSGDYLVGVNSGETALEFLSALPSGLVSTLQEVTDAGNTTTNAITINNTNGITIDPGSDVDAYVFRVDVTDDSGGGLGLPGIAWDESADSFDSTRTINETGLQIGQNSLEVGSAKRVNGLVSLTSDVTNSNYFGNYSFLSINDNGDGYSIASNPAGFGQAGNIGFVTLDGTTSADRISGTQGVVFLDGAGTSADEAYGVAGGIVNVGATITDAHLFGGVVINPFGTITNLYGLKLPDITAGSTSNYAIQTGAGLVDFGDDVDIDGSLVVYQTNGVTQAARIAQGGGSATIFAYNSGTETVKIPGSSADGFFNGGGNYGFGTDNPSRKFHAVDTDIQARFGYDTLNFADIGVDSSGYLNISPTGERISVNNTAALDTFAIRPHGAGFGLTIRELDDGNDAIRLRGYNIGGIIDLFGNGNTNIQINGTNNGRTYFNTGGDFAIGHEDPDVRFHVIDTATQVRFGYDVSNFADFDVDSAGNLNVIPTGGRMDITRSKDATLRFNSTDGVMGDGDIMGSMEFYTTDGSRGPRVSSMIQGISDDAFGATGALTFHAWDGTPNLGRPPEIMRVTGTGVGIGSASPLGKFESRAISGAQIVASYDASNRASFTVDSSGNLNVTPTGDRVKVESSLRVQGDAGLDGLEVWSGSALGGVSLGADVNATTRTSNTRKVGVITSPNYANNDIIEVFSLNSPNVSTNTLSFGGRSGGTNTAATEINFVTAPDTTTTGGSIRMTIDNGGSLQLNEYGSGTNTGTQEYNTSFDSSGNLIETKRGVVTTKATTGDGTGSEGEFQVNTFDNTFKVYAEGAWRTLATW